MSNDIQANLLKLANTAKRHVGDALFEVAEEIMEVAKERTPFDRGNLHRSGRVQPPNLGIGGEVSVRLTFGDESVGYAWYVHENPKAKHAAPTRWKYLESAMDESRGDVLRRVAAKVDLRGAL